MTNICFTQVEIVFQEQTHMKMFLVCLLEQNTEQGALQTIFEMGKLGRVWEKPFDIENSLFFSITDHQELCPAGIVVTLAWSILLMSLWIGSVKTVLSAL